MKDFKWAIYFFALTSLFLVVVPGNALAQMGGDDPCCQVNNSSMIILIDPTINPQADETIITIYQPPFEPAAPFTPQSTDAAAQTGTVPESRLDLRRA